jgi:ribose transport system substrate-binding protein
MKHSNIFRILIAVLLLATFSVVGVKPQLQAQGDNTVRIGMVNYRLDAPYFVGMAEAVRDEASFYSNMEVIITDAGRDHDIFVADLEDVLALNVDGVIISASGALDATDAVLAAIAAADVPIVLVDRLVVEAEFTSWIGPDNFIIGQQNGTYIVERLNEEGRMIVLRGGPEDNRIGLARTGGVLSIVEQYEGIEVILSSDFGGWSTQGGYALMEAMLEAYDQIDAVFCENDSMCLGAQIAIEDADRSDEMFLVGVDGQKDALLQILNGTNYAATGLNNSDQIGRAAFHRMMAILAGAQAPVETTMPSPLITNENASRFYNPDSLF